MSRVLPGEGETSHVTLIESVRAGASDSETDERDELRIGLHMRSLRRHKSELRNGGGLTAFM
jgi:hypothetical protein